MSLLGDAGFGGVVHKLLCLGGSKQILVSWISSDSKWNLWTWRWWTPQCFLTTSVGQCRCSAPWWDLRNYCFEWCKIRVWCSKRKDWIEISIDFIYLLSYFSFWSTASFFLSFLWVGKKKAHDSAAEKQLSHKTESILHRGSCTEQVQFISGVKKLLQYDGCWVFVCWLWCRSHTMIVFVPSNVSLCRFLLFCDICFGDLHLW